MDEWRKMKDTVGSKIKIFILITSPPYTSRSSNIGYEYALFLLNNGEKPIIFHFMDGLHNLSKNQNAFNFPENYKLVKQLIELGADVWCCSRCLMSRGYCDIEKSNLDEGYFATKGIIDNVKVSGISKIAESTKMGYKIIQF